MIEIEHRNRGSRVLPIVAVALGAAGTVVGGSNGLAARADARAAAGRADQIEIVEVRSDLRRTHVAETNALLLGMYGEATEQQIERARDARIASRATARDRAEDLSSGTGEAATEARFLLDLLDADGLDGEREVDPVRLLESGHDAVHDGRAPVEQYDTDVVALYDLIGPDIAGALVVNDALDAMYVITQPEVPEIFAEYVADAESYLRSDGGYLGPDPASPLTASYVYRPSAAMPHPALAEIDEGIASSRLWDYDQWIRSWQIGTPDTAAPLSLADLVAQAGLVDGNTRGIVDATLEDARRSSRDAADSAGIRSTGWLVLGTTSALAAVTATVALVRRRRIATRRAARAVDTDELTGLGNRRLLEQRVGPTLRNPDLGWHLVAAIRMDHVALVNDTWGRSMGDRVLVEVARRLRAIVDDLQASDDVFSGTVVRLGSEFVMTLHSTAPMELETVAEMLEQIRITTIPVDADPDADPDGQAASGDDVALNFDLGIATASGPCDLDDMVRDAELSAWSERQAHRHDPALVTDTQR